MPSRRQDCHFADALSPSLLIHLLTVEGGGSRMTVSPTARDAPRVRTKARRPAAMTVTLVRRVCWNGKPAILLT